MSKKVTQDRARALQWRQDQYKLDETSGFDIDGSVTWYRWQFSDALDPSWAWEFAAEDGRDPPTSKVRAEVNQYRDNHHFMLFTADGGYASNLDQLLDASRFWKYSDPATPLVTTPGYWYWCNLIGSSMRTGQPWNDKSLYIQHGDITGIQFWRDGGALKGIQVWYGGDFSSGPHGAITDASGSINIDPSTDGVTMMGFSANDYIKIFALGTNRIRRNGEPYVGRGDFDSSYNFLPVQDSLSVNDTRLAYISGVTTGDLISQLKVVWRTGEQYTTDLPIEHTVDAINDGFG